MKRPIKEIMAIWSREALKRAPQWTPEKTAPQRIPLAADDQTQSRQRFLTLRTHLADRLGDIHVTESVSVQLVLESETAIWLVFREGDRVSTHFDGREIAFYIPGEEALVTTVVEDGVALLQAEALGIAIEAFDRVWFRLGAGGGLIERPLGKP